MFDIDDLLIYQPNIILTSDVYDILDNMHKYLIEGIARVTSLKVLGVTVTEKLSVAEHVDDVIEACARSMYAISVLRSHGMCASLLQQVFQSVVISKLTYAASAWRVFFDVC